MCTPLSPMLEEQLPAIARSIAKIRATAVNVATTHCNADTQLISDIALCVSEAAANVVAHAYPESDGDITLTISRAPQMLVIEIADTGVGTATRTSRPGLGLGTKIVEALSDASFQLVEGSGLRVTMRFPCQAR
jgi:serine/threonine-protein kinase RsbW